MTDDASENRAITFSVEDAERLVRKSQALEAVLRELVEHFDMRCSPIGDTAANRMLLELASEDLDEWPREITRKQQAHSSLPSSAPGGASSTC
jgi:hypothetical protein